MSDLVTRLRACSEALRAADVSGTLIIPLMIADATMEDAAAEIARLQALVTSYALDSAPAYAPLYGTDLGAWLAIAFICDECRCDHYTRSTP